MSDNMNKIHPTALVHPDAKIGNNVEIGPFCIIEENVVIGDNCKFLNNVVVYNYSRIGNNNTFHQGCSVGNIPQDLKFGQEETELIIGDNNTFREFVTLHRGTSATFKTKIGNNNFVMAYAHIAHDCDIGNNCILANSVNLGGHVHLEDFVIIGGVSGVHQFTKIGKHCMVGGQARIVQDLVPFGLFGDQPLKCAGINLIGLKRRGFSSEIINTLKNAFLILLDKKYNIKQALEKIKELYPTSPEINHLVNFIETSERGIVR